uniref:Uncharacterized protein n=1 Tax=Ixodes ricinus TaxID=34613 RepID=A0A0K8RIQ4_IXORI
MCFLSFQTQVINRHSVLINNPHTLPSPAHISITARIRTSVYSSKTFPTSGPPRSTTDQSTSYIGSLGPTRICFRHVRRLEASLQRRLHLGHPHCHPVMADVGRLVFLGRLQSRELVE